METSRSFVKKILRWFSTERDIMKEEKSKRFSTEVLSLPELIEFTALDVRTMYVHEKLKF